MRQEDNPLLEIGTEGHPVGKNPLDLTENELVDAGHVPMPLIKVIRKNCLDCDDTPSNVRKCVNTDCPLWPYRMGVNPFTAARRRKSIEEK